MKHYSNNNFPWNNNYMYLYAHTKNWRSNHISNTGECLSQVQQIDKTFRYKMTSCECFLTSYFLIHIKDWNLRWTLLDAIAPTTDLIRVRLHTSPVICQITFLQWLEWLMDGRRPNSVQPTAKYIWVWVCQFISSWKIKDTQALTNNTVLHRAIIEQYSFYLNWHSCWFLCELLDVALVL